MSEFEVKETVFKIGDQVKLRDNAERVEANDFDLTPQAFYFEQEDVAIVCAINPPRLF